MNKAGIAILPRALPDILRQWKSEKGASVLGKSLKGRKPIRLRHQPACLEVFDDQVQKLFFRNGHWHGQEIHLGIEDAGQIRPTVYLTPQFTVMLREGKGIAAFAGPALLTEGGTGQPGAEHDAESLDQVEPILVQPSQNRCHPWRIPQMAASREGDLHAYGDVRARVDQDSPWDTYHPFIGTAAGAGREVAGRGGGDILTDDCEIARSQFEDTGTVMPPRTEERIRMRTKFTQNHGMMELDVNKPHILDSPGLRATVLIGCTIRAPSYAYMHIPVNLIVRVVLMVCRDLIIQPKCASNSCVW